MIILRRSLIFFFIFRQFLPVTTGKMLAQELAIAIWPQSYSARFGSWRSRVRNSLGQKKLFPEEIVLIMFPHEMFETPTNSGVESEIQCQKTKKLIR